MMSSGTVVSSAKKSLRVPSSVASASSSSSDVGLAVEDAVALQDGGAADRLGEMTLARARRPEEEDVLALLDEAAGRQVVDERAVHLLVEIEIKGVERAIGVAEARLLDAAGDQPVLAAEQFVADERGDEIDGRLFFGLRLAEAGLERGGHAGEPELAERVSSSTRFMWGLLSADR